jgi:hypothetical protein
MWTAYIKSGAQLQAATLSDYHVKFSPQGDTAIASYLLHVKTLEASKKITDEDFQETDVWFKAAGHMENLACALLIACTPAGAAPRACARARVPSGAGA